MMVIRPVTKDDCPALIELASKTGVGFTSLPDNEARLIERVERMIRTWQGDLPLCQQGYLFVLEDTQTAKVVGICGIEAAIGLDEPWYNYRVGTLVHASKALDVYSQMPTLFLSNDHTGHSELCTLFLDPAYRHSKNGHLLAKSRLLFMATFPDHFANKLIAEMRGVCDPQGRSPFWESLGRHFFAIDFAHADYLTGMGQKSFIAELMPKHPLYVDFLSEEARDVIGQVHPDTIPARKILESEGMRYEGYVDIFDAGPTLEAYIQDLRVFRKAQRWPVKVVGAEIIGTKVVEAQIVEAQIVEAQIVETWVAETKAAGTVTPLSERLYLIGNESYAHYRVISGTPEFSGTHLLLTQSQAGQLQVSEGDYVRVATLFAEERKQ